ncbi:MAG TPA: SHOCT domain-containing protein [Mycobacterium sp.]|nr:SHOCT domain-containing protein [Mycobacterium sp.]
MAVLMVVLVVAVIVAIVFAVRYLAGGRPLDHQAGSDEMRAENAVAENTVAERFARGEIDEDEFRRRMTLLREHR